MRLEGIVLAVLAFSWSAVADVPRIACVGDSLTDSPYPTFLQEMCGDRCVVKSWAKKGAKVGSISRFVSRALKEFRPTHVVILAGINDCASSQRPDPYRIFDGIAAIVSRVLDTGATPVVVALHTAGGHGIEAHCSAMVNIQLCDFPENVIRVGWTSRGLTDQNGQLWHRYDSGDGVHLNASGYRELARLVFEEVF